MTEQPSSARRDGPPDVGVRPPGFRLPAATRPGPVTLQVADLDRSLEFYRDLIGLRLLDRSDGVVRLGPHPALGASGDPSEPWLFELRERPGARPLAPRSRLGLFHTAVLLPSRSDLGRLLRHLQGAGTPVGASDHAVSEALYLTDPDGLGLEVYRDRSRSDWRTRGPELVMTTEPLDAVGVVDSADGPWNGVPAGSRIGHLHLHVGGLDEASEFYHRGLGLDRIVWSYPGALFLSAGGYHHHLGTNTWAGGAPPAGEDEARLLEWSLLVPDPAALEDAAASLAEAGAQPIIEDRALVADDPWGTTLRVAVAGP